LEKSLLIAAVDAASIKLTADTRRGWIADGSREQITTVTPSWIDHQPGRLPW
jgi:hypothetical protein